MWDFVPSRRQAPFVPKQHLLQWVAPEVRRGVGASCHAGASHCVGASHHATLHLGAPKTMVESR